MLATVEISRKIMIWLSYPEQIWIQTATKVWLSSPMRLCFSQLYSEWITGSKSSACFECYNRWASTVQGSRCHMVHRVKPGELCGTIVGLPWHQKTRRGEMEGRWGGEYELQDSVGYGGGLQLLEGISVSWQRRKTFWGCEEGYYERRGQSS